MKLNKIFTFIVLFVASIATSSCTQNGGDIGIWFGTWIVKSVSIDGVVQPQSTSTYFSVQFQGQIVRVTQVDERHEPYNCTYGNWTEDANQMQWLFPDKKQPMMPLPGMTRVNKFTITQKNSEAVVLQQVSESGVTYVYLLEKLV